MIEEKYWQKNRSKWLSFYEIPQAVFWDRTQSAAERSGCLNA